MNINNLCNDVLLSRNKRKISSGISILSTLIYINIFKDSHSQYKCKCMGWDIVNSDSVQKYMDYTKHIHSRYADVDGP